MRRVREAFTHLGVAKGALGGLNFALEATWHVSCQQDSRASDGLTIWLAYDIQRSGCLSWPWLAEAEWRFCHSCGHGAVR